MLACAFAADTPTINAKMLNPPIKACFITAPPFRQGNATLFIGSINNNKIKDADGRRRPIFEAVPGKSSSTPPHLCLQGTQPRTISAAALSFAGVRRRPSVVDALSAGSGLPAPRAGALPARVWNAEAAVARNHLLHAHLEGWDGAILVHDPSADICQRAPRPLVGLAGTRIKGHGRRHGSRDEDDSHGWPPAQGPGHPSLNCPDTWICRLETLSSHGQLARICGAPSPGAVLPKRHSEVHSKLGSANPWGDRALARGSWFAA